MKDIDYAKLYGVLPGETDFSGAIQRLKEKYDNGPQHFMSKEYQKAIDESLKEYYKNHPEEEKEYKRKKNLIKEGNKLIYAYNLKMKDDVNYPDKDQVRRWFGVMSQRLIDQGADSYQFLYPDFMGPIEILKEIYNKNINTEDYE